MAVESERFSGKIYLETVRAELVEAWSGKLREALGLR